MAEKSKKSAVEIRRNWSVMQTLVHQKARIPLERNQYKRKGEGGKTRGEKRKKGGTIIE